MRLSHKLAVALTAAILAVLATNSLVRVRREIRLFDHDMRSDSRLLGRAVAGAAGRVWTRVGEHEAIDVVEDANEREAQVLIRWVWLDAPHEDEHAPSVPVAQLGRLPEPVAMRWHPAGQDEEALFTYVAVVGPGPRRIAVELRESLAAERRYIHDTVIQAAIATGSLVVVAGVLTLGLGVILVGRPVRRLVEQARRIGSGDLASRLRSTQRDELGELGREMDLMSDLLAQARDDLELETVAKLAAVEQLRHADRLATIGKLSAGIAHEVGTPLNVITGYAQVIAEDAPPDGVSHECASIITEQAHRVAEIIRQLLEFARPRSAKKAQHGLGAIAAQPASLLETLAKKRDVSIVVREAHDDVSASVDVSQLQQVVTNLVVNAVHASPAGATVELGCERRLVSPPADHGGPRGTYACLFVCDHGTGIAPDVLPRIFEPFFTTKDVGDGTGLGLSVAYGIVKEHGGWLEVTTELGRGTCFTVYLPSEDVALRSRSHQEAHEVQTSRIGPWIGLVPARDRRTIAAHPARRGRRHVPTARRAVAAPRRVRGRRGAERPRAGHAGRRDGPGRLAAVRPGDQ